MKMERKIVQYLLCSGFSISLLCYIGCSSSVEMGKEEVTQQTPGQAVNKPMPLHALLLKDSQEENDSLKTAIASLQQHVRMATARTAEMEARLGELKNHQLATLVEERKPEIKASVPVIEEAMPVVSAPPPKVTGNVPSGDPNSMYGEGLRLFHTRNYRGALKNFETVSLNENGKELAARGIYWSGECRYALKDYNGAIEFFQKVLAFQNSTKNDDALMMIGNCCLKLGKKERAKEELQKLIANYPASHFIKVAKTKLKQL